MKVPVEQMHRTWSSNVLTHFDEALIQQRAADATDPQTVNTDHLRINPWMTKPTSPATASMRGCVAVTDISTTTGPQP